MATIKTTIDGMDHLETGELDNQTVCGLDMPFGSAWGYVTREGTTNPCPKCFPDEAKASKAAKAATKAA